MMESCPIHRAVVEVSQGHSLSLHTTSAPVRATTEEVSCVQGECPCGNISSTRSSHSLLSPVVPALCEHSLRWFNRGLWHWFWFSVLFVLVCHYCYLFSEAWVHLKLMPQPHQSWICCINTSSLVICVSLYTANIIGSSLLLLCPPPQKELRRQFRLGSLNLRHALGSLGGFFPVLHLQTVSSSVWISKSGKGEADLTGLWITF